MFYVLLWLLGHSLPRSETVGLLDMAPNLWVWSWNMLLCRIFIILQSFRWFTTKKTNPVRLQSFFSGTYCTARGHVIYCPIIGIHPACWPTHCVGRIHEREVDERTNISLWQVSYKQSTSEFTQPSWLHNVLNTTAMLEDDSGLFYRNAGTVGPPSCSCACLNSFFTSLCSSYWTARCNGCVLKKLVIRFIWHSKVSG